MLEDIDARDKLARLRRRRPFGNRGVVVVYDGRRIEQLSKACAEAPLAGALVKHLAKNFVFHELCDQWRKLDRGDAIGRVRMQILLLGAVRI